jgi:hypothetical protein
VEHAESDDVELEATERDVQAPLMVVRTHGVATAWLLPANRFRLGSGVSSSTPSRRTATRRNPGDPDRFTFFLPGSSMWFDVTVDGRGRLLTQRLVDSGNDIRYRFTYPG